MSSNQKKELIWKIIEAMKNKAILHNKQFDAGDMFFSLAFKSKKELKKIYSLLAQ